MTMNDKPKPKPPPAKPEPERPKVDQVFSGKAAAPKERPKYVQKPHLTERPFKDHSGLLAMRKQLESSNRGQTRTKKEKK